MKRGKLASASLLSILILGCAAVGKSEAASQSAEAHAKAGVDAGKAFPGLVSLCDLNSRITNVASLLNGAPGAAPQGARPPSATPRPPQPVVAPLAAMQVFDNLYFVGINGVSAWLLGTPSDGYILIDALNSDEETKTFVEGGMKKLGLDPSMIKYMLITHAHGDHYGGHRYILSTYHPRVVMSEADWKVAEATPPHPRFGPAPTRDMSVTEGQTITLGKTTIEIHVTPGHTPGTISPIFTVYDKGVAHRAVLWGGTGFNFGTDVARFRQYAASADALAAIAAKEKVDVFLSNHPPRDGADVKMAALAKRQAGQPNPFVMGDTARGAFTVFRECALAQAERFSAAPQ